MSSPLRRPLRGAIRRRPREHRFSPTIARGTAQECEEWLAAVLQLFFQAGGAVAVSTGPRFGAVVVAALAAVVGVLNSDQFEILFPVRTLFLQRSWTVTDFDPASAVVGGKLGMVHIAQVFAFGDRTSAKRAALDAFKQGALKTGFDSGPNQVSHAYRLPRTGFQAWSNRGGQPG